MRNCEITGGGGSGGGFDATLAADAAPGSGNVIFTPWLKGERSPVADRTMRAGFHNMSLATTQADLVRSVLEGVAYNNQWLHEAVEKFVRPVRQWLQDFF